MGIEVAGICKTFGSFTALQDVHLQVPLGELVALLGPSGSGKTTLLRIIAGLETPDAGSLLFAGQDATQRSAKERRVGFVFQHYALFRHMSVFENVAFGLRVRPRRQRPSPVQIQQRVEALLRLVQLEGLARRRPGQLSGGQRQRVALARALAIEPRVLLLDEPFGALDATVRQELRRWLRRLHDEMQITSLFVTHDQEEALEVADRVVIMNGGRIEQIGSPEQVYERPANPFVCRFLGRTNMFRPEAPAAQEMIGFVRPHDLELQRQADTDAIAVVVQHVQCVGPTVHIQLQRQSVGDLLEAQLSKDSCLRLAPRIGEVLYVRARRVQVFGKDDPREKAAWSRRELMPSIL